MTDARPRGSGCPAVAPSGPASPGPTAPAPTCIRPRTVLYKLPRVRGRVVRTRVTADGRRVRVKRGVAYVRLRRPGSTVRVRVTRVVRRGGRRVTVRSARTFKVCPR